MFAHTCNMDLAAGKAQIGLNVFCMCKFTAVASSEVALANRRATGGREVEFLMEQYIYLHASFGGINQLFF